MKTLVIILLLLVAIASSNVIISQPQEDESDLLRLNDDNLPDDDDSYVDFIPSSSSEDDDDSDEMGGTPSERGLIISSIVKKTLKAMIKQMPCGWPEAGVPPLAPYRREEINMRAKRSFMSTVSQLVRFKLDGLDNINIKKFSVSFIGKKVKFHLIFRNIRATSKFNTDSLIDLLNELGFRVRYEGQGAVDLSLINLSIKGSFKYKAPLIWGSMKIYKFKIGVTLGNCKSNFTGIAPTSNMTRMINNHIEDTILSSINDNQAEISSQLEQVIVPNINDSLKGMNIWDVIAAKPPKPDGKCVPPPDPWA